MKYQFKKGDRIVCLNTEECVGLTLGKEYTALSAVDGGNKIPRVQVFEEHTYGYPEARFRLAFSESVVKIVSDLSSLFKISEDHLAAWLIGVTSNTLKEWKKLPRLEDVPEEKGARLKRLYEVVGYLQEIRPKYTGERVYNVLMCGEIPLMEATPECDTSSLNGYIFMAPHCINWRIFTRIAVLNSEGKL